MAQVVDDVDFWLSPPHFLSPETAPLKINKAVAGSKIASSKQEFPYDFGLLKSELSSPVEIEEEEEGFFAELNRRLAFSEARKVSTLDFRQPSEVYGGSPESILGGIGSWSGRSSNESHQSPLLGPSPPATPYEVEYDVAGLVNAAAGRVERLNMSSEGPLNSSVNGQFRNTKPELNHLSRAQNHKAGGVLTEQNYLAAARLAYNAALLYEHHLQNLNGSMRHSRGLYTQSKRPSIQPQLLSVSTTKANFHSAPLQRKESGGTGVFLPRRYNTALAAPPRKRAVNTTPIVPAKVVQALNTSFVEMNTRWQPHYSAYSASMSQNNYEALIARKNAYLAQQQPIVAIAEEHMQSNLEMCLPHEWSY